MSDGGGRGTRRRGRTTTRTVIEEDAGGESVSEHDKDERQHPGPWKRSRTLGRPEATGSGDVWVKQRHSQSAQLVDVRSNVSVTLTNDKVGAVDGTGDGTYDVGAGDGGWTGERERARAAVVGPGDGRETAERTSQVNSMYDAYSRVASAAQPTTHWTSQSRRPF
jgi:hypothetical protein